MLSAFAYDMRGERLTVKAPLRRAAVAQTQRKSDMNSTTRAASFAMLVAASLPLAVAQPAWAQADRFTHAKKTVVPSSRFNRRFDDESVSFPEVTPLTSAPKATPSASSATSPKSVTTGIAPVPAVSATVSPEVPPVAPSRNGAGLSAEARSVDWTATSRPTDVPSSAVLAKAKARVQPLLNSGKYDTAQSLMQTYVKQYPQDKLLKAELAKVAVKNSEHKLQQSLPQAAASCARVALSADPNYQPARTTLSQALTKLGIDPSNPAERLKLADGLLAQSRSQEAVVEYAESLRFKPTAEAHIGLGDAHWRSGRKDLAKTEYQRALELNQKSSLAYRQLGILKYQENDIVGANADLSKALILNPNDKPAGTHLVELWRAQVSRSPNLANSHMGLARAYQLTGDLTTAQSEYREVVKLEPTHPALPQARKSFKVALARQQAQSAYESAHVLEKQGKLNDAHTKATEAVTLHPTNSQMRLYHAQLSQKLGLNNEAHAGYLAVLKQDPTSDEAAAGLRALPAQTLPVSIADETPPLAPPLVAPGAVAGTAAGIAAAAGGTAPTVANAGTFSDASAAGYAAAQKMLGLNGIAPAVPAAPAVAAPPVVAGIPGTIMQPLPPPLDPTAPYKPYTTDTHVATMSNFLGQIRNLAQAAQAIPSAAAAPADIGGPPLLGGGAPPPLATTQTLASAPVPGVDSGGVSNVLAQAAAALKAAGAPLPAPSVVSAVSTVVPALAPTAKVLSEGTPAPAAAASAAPAAAPASTAAPAAATPVSATAANAAPAAAAVAAPASAPINAAVQQSLAALGLPNIPELANANPAMLSQLAQQYGPVIQVAAKSMTPEQFNGLYQSYRPMLEQQLGVSLPANINASPAAVACAAGSISQIAQAPGYGAGSFVQPGLPQWNSALPQTTVAGNTGSGGNVSSAGATAKNISALAANEAADADPFVDNDPPYVEPEYVSPVPQVGNYSGNTFNSKPTVATDLKPLPPMSAKAQALLGNSSALIPSTSPGSSAIVSASSSAPLQAPAGTGLPVSLPATATASVAAPNAVPAIAIAPNSSAPVPGVSPDAVNLMPPPPIGSTMMQRPVELQLLGVSHTGADLQIEVSLKNGQDVPFKVPSSTKAVIEVNGKQQNAKVQFADRVVPPHGELRGTIKVTGHDLSPSADLWIPNVLPGTGSERNLHLSVNMPSSM